MVATVLPHCLGDAFVEVWRATSHGRSARGGRLWGCFLIRVSGRRIGRRGVLRPISSRAFVPSARRGWSGYSKEPRMARYGLARPECRWSGGGRVRRGPPDRRWRPAIRHERDDGASTLFGLHDGERRTPG